MVGLTFRILGYIEVISCNSSCWLLIFLILLYFWYVYFDEDDMTLG
jgi:hypothetical protein